MENVWATEKVLAGGEAGHNPPDNYIAHLPESANVDYAWDLPKAYFIKLTAHADGSFVVTNSRNGFTKEYAARE